MASTASTTTTAAAVSVEKTEVTASQASSNDEFELVSETAPEPKPKEAPTVTTAPKVATVTPSFAAADVSPVLKIKVVPVPRDNETPSVTGVRLLRASEAVETARDSLLKSIALQEASIAAREAGVEEITTEKEDTVSAASLSGACVLVNLGKTPIRYMVSRGCCKDDTPLVANAAPVTGFISSIKAAIMSIDYWQVLQIVLVYWIVVLAALVLFNVVCAIGKALFGGKSSTTLSSAATTTYGYRHIHSPAPAYPTDAYENLLASPSSPHALTGDSSVLLSGARPVQHTSQRWMFVM